MHLSGHYIFSIKFEAFCLQTKIYPTLQQLNGQISNYSIKYIFFPREVRDKNKESSIFTQNSWIVDICLILLYLTKCGHCSKKSLKIYQSGNQNPYIEEEQTTQWPIEKRTNNDLWNIHINVQIKYMYCFLLRIFFIFNPRTTRQTSQSQAMQVWDPEAHCTSR